MSELPSGWQLPSLNEVADVIRGVSYKKHESSSINQDGYLPVLRANNIHNGRLSLDNLVYVKANNIKEIQKLKAGDVVIAMSSGSKKLVGKSGTSKQDYEGSFGAFCSVLRPSSELEIRFIGLFTRSKEYLNSVSLLSKGVNINNLKVSHFSEIRIPIPPLNEQTRIANKLDSLLAKVDAAQARLDKIPALLKRFRQSVLAAATSGELTREWREEVNVRSWDNKRLIDLIISKPRNGKSPKGVDYQTKTKNLTLTSITNGYFSDGHYKYVDLEVPSDSYLWVKKDDILIQRANSIEYVGVSAIYEGDDDKYIYPDLIMKFRANDYILTKYLHYSLLSSNVRKYFRDNATGVAGNMPKINQTTVSNAPIALPTKKEQKEIVRRVESLFTLADTVEKQYQDAKQRIDRLTQSILAKAFRGELVPQDPNDEPASELLKRIQAEREAQKPVKKTRKKKTKASQQTELPV